MSVGKIFTEKDLTEQTDNIALPAAPAGDDPLGRFDNVITNIDKMLGHVQDLKEKHPELFGRGATMGGGGNMPAMMDAPTPDRQANPAKMYAALLGMLNKAGDTPASELKEMVIKNKGRVMSMLQEAMR